MAKVWFIREGPKPGPGRANPHYKLCIGDCEKQLGLARNDFLSPPETEPNFEDKTGLASIAGNKHVIVEIEETEGAPVGWSPGFYFVHVSPSDVVEKLGRPDDPIDMQSTTSGGPYALAGVRRYPTPGEAL